MTCVASAPLVSCTVISGARDGVEGVIEVEQGDVDVGLDEQQAPLPLGSPSSGVKVSRCGVPPKLRMVREMGFVALGALVRSKRTISFGFCTSDVAVPPPPDPA